MARIREESGPPRLSDRMKSHVMASQTTAALGGAKRSIQKFSLIADIL
jgi:hypothetical protein